MRDEHLAVVIPARNEELTVGAIAEEARLVASGLASKVTILVVDDGSWDKTSTVARSAGATVISGDGEGLARAFSVGMHAALAREVDTIAHIDADGQYSVASLAPLYRKYQEGWDLVLGNRLWRHPPGMSDFRYAWNRYLSELVSLVAGLAQPDTQTGLRVFSRSVANLPIRSSFTYTQEQFVRAARGAFSVCCLDVPFGARAAGSSRLVRSPLDYLALVMRDLEHVAAELGVDLERLQFL